MKNLLLALLLFVSVAAVGQVTVTENPSLVSPGTTTVQYVDLPSDVSAKLPLTILVKFPSTNVGTVQLNTYSSTMTNAPANVADTYTWITVYSTRFWVKCSNSADDIEISW